MERISWKERTNNEEMLKMLNENRCLIKTMCRRKKKWIGHVLKKGWTVEGRHHHHHHQRFTSFFSHKSAGLTSPTNKTNLIRLNKILLLHSDRSCASSFFRPNPLMSVATHSIHAFLPLPFFTFPFTSKLLHLETQSSAALLSTRPYHLSLLRLTTLSRLSIPNPCLSSSLVLLSFMVTPDIHLTMVFSVLRSRCISSTFIAQVSLPYKSTLCTHALYIFPFTLKEAPLAVSNILSSMNFPQAHLTLALEDSSAPPPFPITSFTCHLRVDNE